MDNVSLLLCGLIAVMVIGIIAFGTSSACGFGYPGGPRPLREGFSNATRFTRGSAYKKNPALPGEPTVRKELKPEEYKEEERPAGCTSNEIDVECESEIAAKLKGAKIYAGVVERTKNGPSSTYMPGIESAGIVTSKYGEYGSAGSKPVETFDPTCSNARLMGSLLDTSCFAGVMDGKLHDPEKIEKTEGYTPTLDKMGRNQGYSRMRDGYNSRGGYS